MNKGLKRITRKPWAVTIGPPEHCRVGAVGSRVTAGNQIIATVEYGVYGVHDPAEVEAIAHLIANAPQMRNELERLANLAAKINDKQHAGNPIAPEEWSGLYASTVSAFKILADVDLPVKGVK